MFCWLDHLEAFARTGRSCCMIRMQCQIPPTHPHPQVPDDNGNSVQTLRFSNSVNHQGPSCETTQAQHYITRHGWKEGVNKYEVNLAKGAAVQADNSRRCNKSRYHTAHTQHDTIYTLPSTRHEPHFTSCHVLLTIFLPVSLLTLSWFPSNDFLCTF